MYKPYGPGMAAAAAAVIGFLTAYSVSFVFLIGVASLCPFPAPGRQRVVERISCKIQTGIVFSAVNLDLNESWSFSQVSFNTAREQQQAPSALLDRLQKVCVKTFTTGTSGIRKMLPFIIFHSAWTDLSADKWDLTYQFTHGPLLSGVLNGPFSKTLPDYN